MGCSVSQTQWIPLGLSPLSRTMWKCSAESGNSPPTKMSCLNISLSLTQDITAHMKKHLVTFMYQQKKMVHSVNGTTTLWRWPIFIYQISYPMWYCQTLSLAHLDLWFIEESNCRFQLTKLADASVIWWRTGGHESRDSVGTYQIIGHHRGLLECTKCH